MEGTGVVAALLVFSVEQYLCSKSSANLTSPTTQLLSESTILLQLGEENVFSHVLRVSIRQSEGSLYCFLMASRVPTLTRSCIPTSYHFARTLFNSSLTTGKSSTLSCWPAVENVTSCQYTCILEGPTLIANTETYRQVLDWSQCLHSTVAVKCPSPSFPDQRED